MVRNVCFASCRTKSWRIQHTYATKLVGIEKKLSIPTSLSLTLFFMPAISRLSRFYMLVSISFSHKY